MDRNKAVWRMGGAMGGLAPEYSRATEGLVLSAVAIGLLMLFAVIQERLQHKVDEYLTQREMGSYNGMQNLEINERSDGIPIIEHKYNPIRLSGPWIAVGIHLTIIYSLFTSYEPWAIAFGIAMTYFGAVVLWKVPDLGRWIFGLFFR